MVSACTVLFVTLYFVMVVCVRGEHTESNGNDQILQTEIAEALKECDESAERTEAQQEYIKRTKRTKEIDRAVTKEFRNKRNINVMMEGLRDYLREDSESGEWDYGGGDGKKNTWIGAGEDKSSVENIYQHGKRNNSFGSRYGSDIDHGSNGTSSGNNGSRSVQKQNSTRYNQNDVQNNFDSRGAGRLMKVGMRNDHIDNGTKYGLRKKRSDRLVDVTTHRECLSQCVFINLKVVDDRGIPKEAMFNKLIEDRITSQQMRILMQRQFKDCFHQLTGESQDDGCSYSNSLENCLGLRLKERQQGQDNVTSFSV